MCLTQVKIWNVWQTVRRINIEILGVKGLMWISESLKKINLSPGKVLEICFYKRLSFWWQTNQLRKKFGHFKRHLTLWTTHETCFNMEEPLCRVKAEYNKFAVYLSFIIEEFPFHKPWKKSLLKIPVFNNCHWCKILKCRWRHKKRHPNFCMKLSFLTCH